MSVKVNATGLVGTGTWLADKDQETTVWKKYARLDKEKKKMIANKVYSTL